MFPGQKHGPEVWPTRVDLHPRFTTALRVELLGALELLRGFAEAGREHQAPAPGERLIGEHRRRAIALGPVLRLIAQSQITGARVTHGAEYRRCTECARDVR